MAGKPTEGTGGGGQIDHPNINAFVVGATGESKPVVRKPKSTAKKTAAAKKAAATKKAAEYVNTAKTADKE